MTKQTTPTRVTKPLVDKIKAESVRVADLRTQAKRAGEEPDVILTLSEAEKHLDLAVDLLKAGGLKKTGGQP